MDYSTLEKRLLLKCAESPLSRRYVTQLYRKFPKTERESSVAKLIKQGMLVSEEMPKPGARRTPVFYKLTPKGQKWVDEYLANYPD